MKKTFIFLMTIVSLIGFSSCNNDYNIQISDGVINIQMPHPSIGIVGINQVHWDVEPEVVEEKVFNRLKLRSYNGNYDVFVTFSYTDSYGNKQLKDRRYVCSLNGREVKQYKSYGYFRGSIPFEKATGWKRY